MTANVWVSRDGNQAVLFAFRDGQQFNTPAAPVRLRGLDEKALYRIDSVVDGKLVSRHKEGSGAYLMNNGLTLNLRGDYDAAAIILERQN